jgi:hypothetical protein
MPPIVTKRAGKRQRAKNGRNAFTLRALVYEKLCACF